MINQNYNIKEMQNSFNKNFNVENIEVEGCLSYICIKIIINDEFDITKKYREKIIQHFLTEEGWEITHHINENSTINTHKGNLNTVIDNIKKYGRNGDFTDIINFIEYVDKNF